MSLLKLTNNSIGRLAANVAAVDTSISLVSGDGAKFPSLAAGEYFPATLVRGSDGAVEIVKVTARSTDTLTVTRAQESTSAKAFVAGDRIELRLTAQTFLDQLVDTATHAATSKSTPIDNDEIPLVDSDDSNKLKKLTWANLKSVVLAAIGAVIAGSVTKDTPVDADAVLLSDSAASGANKKLTWAKIKEGIFSSWGVLINGGTAKTTPADADAIAIMDSAASNATKTLTWTNLKSALKTYFDTIYSAGGGRPAPNFVNGSAMIAQRTGTINLSTSRQYGHCDNIGIFASGGAVSAGTLTQTTLAISGTTGYSARASGVTLTGSGQISHSIRMEARDAVKYKNKTCSFSVKVDHDVGSNINYTLVVKKANSADNFGATTTISTSGTTSVPSATGTTLTFNGVAMGDCSNGIEFEVQAACGSVTTKNFNCTEFSIDIAATAQSYSAPDQHTELARCKRYLPAFNSSGASTICAIVAQTATTGRVVYPFSVEPRIAPTGISTTSVGNFYAFTTAGTTVSISSLTFSDSSVAAANLSMSVGAASFSAGGASFMLALSANQQILFTGCEL